MRLGAGSGATLTKVTYDEAEPNLTALISQFGPPRKSDHPKLPFWRLQRDGAWTVAAPDSAHFKVECVCFGSMPR
jgi:predicted restriction endonuclease